jgi:hypothetical protein
MDNYPPEVDPANDSPLDKLASLFGQYGRNARNNLGDAFESMTIQGYIRLVAVIGGYILLRTYLLKGAQKQGVRNLEKQEKQEKEQAKLGANEFRGVKEKLEELEDDDDDNVDSVPGWGQQARVRQRKAIKHLMEVEERRRQEEEDDKDIEEYLVD